MLRRILRDALLVDDRWAQRDARSHAGSEILGIRRFAFEVLKRLPSYARLPAGLPILHPLEPLWITTVLLRQRPRMYFSPGFNPPVWSPVPFAFAVWDLVHLRVDDESSRTKSAYYRLVVRPGARRAGRVLTGSSFWQHEVAEWAGIAEKRVVVVGCGVGPAFRPNGPRHEPGYPYLLYVGNRKPHKNLPRLLEAFARSGLAKEMRVVLMGQPDEETRGVAARLRVAHAISFAGFVPDERLAAYYRGATALVIPSLVEGFALPAVEAMASGAPVLASNTTSLPEVVGDAALLVDPYDVDSIATALRRITEDEHTRGLCRERGLARAREFTWERTANATLEALQAALDG